MEKIKSVLSPGKKTDDEMMYGSGNTTHNTGVTGEGSHFDHTGNARLNDPNTASQPVHGQAFTSEGNQSGSMAGTTGIRPESNIHQENYRGQEPYSSGTTSTNAGPHGTMGNKLDPRVDSDLDGRSGLGNTQNTHSTSGLTGSSHTGTGYQASSNAGPHGTMGNKLDPRVDSDRDGRSGLGNTHNTTGNTGYNTGVTDSNHGSSNAGPVHNSAILNKVDPRVDSSAGSSGLTGGSYNTTETRQNMPGRFPSESQHEAVHNPYTSHEVDPRIGGSTQQSSGRGEQYTTGTQPTSGLNNQYQNESHATGQKGLNAARTEDYSQDRSTGHSTTGRDAAAVGGAGLAGAAAGHGIGHSHSNENSHLDSTPRSDAYSGTTASGNNNNYHAAPTGTATGGLEAPISDGRRESRRGSAVNLPPPQGAVAAGLMTHYDHHDPNVAPGGGEVSSAMGSGHHSSNAGPHGTVGNKLDPRVDSDRDGRSAVAGSHNTHSATGSGLTGGQHASSNAGPHGTVGNKLDPRVDSDRDGRSGVSPQQNTDSHGGLVSKIKSAVTGGAAGGAAAHHGTHGNEYDNRGTGNVSDPAYGSQTGNSGYNTGISGGNHTSSNAGPHGTVGNKLDPRVDSDRDGRGTGNVSDPAYGSQTGNSGYNTGISGGNHTSSNAGPHGTVGNKLDPRVDSMRDDGYTKAAATARIAGDGRSHGSYAGNDSNTSGTGHGVGSAHQKPIPGVESIDLPRGNQYGQDVKDPRYGLPMSAAGVTAAEAKDIRHHGDSHDRHHSTHKDTTTHDTTHDTTQKKRRSSLLGFLHRDKNKKYTKEEEAEFDRQEREHNARCGLAGAGVAGAGVAGYEAEKNKPLPPNPGQTGQQMNLTDRTRQQTGDTTSAPAYTGGMVDAQGNPIRDQTTMGGDIPVSESEYGRGNTFSNLDREREGQSGLGGSSAYPTGASDGRDYPVGNTGTGEGLSSKVAQRDDGRNVLHKKAHVIHPGAGEGEGDYDGRAPGTGPTGGSY